MIFLLLRLGKPPHQAVLSPRETLEKFAAVVRLSPRVRGGEPRLRLYEEHAVAPRAVVVREAFLGGAVRAELDVCAHGRS